MPYTDHHGRNSDDIQTMRPKPEMLSADFWSAIKPVAVKWWIARNIKIPIIGMDIKPGGRHQFISEQLLWVSEP
jgi:hypothetical protein